MDFFGVSALAHRLELAVKNALKNTAFDFVEHSCIMYMRKRQKNAENYMKLCLISENALALMNGVKLIRASGSRWVSHKLNVMRRILSKYGAYTWHCLRVVPLKVLAGLNFVDITTSDYMPSIIC